MTLPCFDVMILCSFRQGNSVFIYSFIFSFVLCAPYIGYCYYKVRVNFAGADYRFHFTSSGKQRKKSPIVEYILHAWVLCTFTLVCVTI